MYYINVRNWNRSTITRLLVYAFHYGHNQHNIANTYVTVILRLIFFLLLNRTEPIQKLFWGETVWAQGTLVRWGCTLVPPG